MRHAASVMKNVHGLAPNAPLASTNAVKGKGGGITPSAATLTAAWRLARLFTRSRREGLISSVSPCSPSLRPIQKVTAAAGDGAGRGQERVQPEERRAVRAARITTAKSIPSGSKNTSDAVERAEQDQSRPV